MSLNRESVQLTGVVRVVCSSIPPMTRLVSPKYRSLADVTLLSL